MALQGILASDYADQKNGEFQPEGTAMDAVEFADAMIKQLTYEPFQP
jgi:hypothetical protein